MDYQKINAETIDRWVEEGWEWGQPISHEEYIKARHGIWDVVLTPTKKVPHEWFGDLTGKKVLGLASGGGQQMPVFAALGADCTVLDYSVKQLESERYVAEREGYDIHIIRGDMTKTLPFEDEAFDLIFHPVSNCYVKDVKGIWKECWRVLKKAAFSYPESIIISIMSLMKTSVRSSIVCHSIQRKMKIIENNSKEMMPGCSFHTPSRNRLMDSLRWVLLL